MNKILFIIPDEAMMDYTKEVLAPNYLDIEVVAATPSEGVKIVQDRISSGLEVVAARAITAYEIKNARLNISVVEIPTTSFDIVRAISEAKLYGKNIAVITFLGTVLGIDFLDDALGVKIKQYAINYKQDLEKEIMDACSKGADVILGGVSANKAAKKLKVPHSMIKIGNESLLQAAREAKQIHEALEIETAKRGFYSSVLDYAYEGIVTIDKELTITAFNPVAQKVTKLNKTVALGRPIEDIFPQLQLEKVLEKNKDDLHQIINVNGVTILCNKVPIVVNGKSFGAVATFQEISKIQQMEAVIRKQIYARGHIAKFNFEEILGKSPSIKVSIETAKDYATTNFSILILGETGTGKEVFAQSIHNASEHSKGPFVAINCAALPAQILESELFGYVGGAFTGANKEGKPGLFEVAHGGTIFLDEIAEMDYVNQGRLLRVLQERTVVRLGSHNVLPIDVRVIAATNKDLELLVCERKFRDDLYYRLDVLRLNLPPLRERKVDIRLYAGAFLNEFSSPSGRELKLSPDAFQFLEDYFWPGNIRELMNYMQRIAATSKASIISKSMLIRMFEQRKVNAPITSPKEIRMIGEIKKALQETNGNCSSAAKILGIHRVTLRRRMQRLNIEY